MKPSYSAPRIHRGATLPVALCGLLLVCLTAFAAQAADDYHLGPMDKLHIRVAQWQAADGTLVDWSSIDGDYVVGPSGRLSFPFIGETPASGKTTSELAEAIGAELQQTLGLIDPPTASIELIEFRPVFLAGSVESPGKYSYFPGLNVLKAVSLAGGLRRETNSGMRLERDYINAHGSYAVLAAERKRLVARKARLAAEAAESASIDVPEELTANASDRALVDEESSYMDARRKRLDRQLKAIDDLKELLNNEIKSLEQKISTQKRQVELTEKELESISGLAERGLAKNQRVLDLQRSIAELKGKVLDYETAVLRAKQDANKATQNATNLQNDRETEIAQQRQETDAAIEAINLKIAMYESLMSETLVQAPQAASFSAGENLPITYTIVRTAEGKTTEISAEETTPVLPGDVVKVSIALPATQ